MKAATFAKGIISLLKRSQACLQKRFPGIRLEQTQRTLLCSYDRVGQASPGADSRTWQRCPHGALCAGAPSARVRGRRVSHQGSIKLLSPTVCGRVSVPCEEALRGHCVELKPKLP